MMVQTNPDKVIMGLHTVDLGMKHPPGLRSKLFVKVLNCEFTSSMYVKYLGLY